MTRHHNLNYIEIPTQNIQASKAFFTEGHTKCSGTSRRKHYSGYFLISGRAPFSFYRSGRQRICCVVGIRPAPDLQLLADSALQVSAITLMLAANTHR